MSSSWGFPEIFPKKQHLMKRSDRNDKTPAQCDARAASIRIDKLLWYLRFTRSRNMAQKLAEKGLIRLNGNRVSRAHQPVRQNDILTIPKGREVHVVRLVCLPKRRGSAAVTASYYEQLQLGDESNY